MREADERDRLQNYVTRGPLELRDVPFMTQLLEKKECRCTKRASRDTSGPNGDEREAYYGNLSFSSVSGRIVLRYLFQRNRA